ncbi:hypothetical protein RCO48_15335 [Peribacillus frigoritolerans]|nr:hypothetical protein [Peribacillus frigoritolerans]
MCDELKEKGLNDLFRDKTGLLIDAYFFRNESEMDPR